MMIYHTSTDTTGMYNVPKSTHKVVFNGSGGAA